jgi:polysaccharide pyruvyl transferase WcaK-like protein
VNEIEKSNNVPSVLLVGYNGANNTGSEARLLTIIKEVRSVIGKNTLITIPTLNEKNLRRYLNETSTLKIEAIPSIFYFSLKKLVKDHDIIILVEGSCYMDTWSTVLLRAFLWATSWANEYDKPCIAYAVDSGNLSNTNKRKVKKEASKTGLIIMRTQAAADRLKEIGVKAPIEVTADTAFCFYPKFGYRNILWDIWPQAKEKQVVGMALINPYCWPVKFQLIGKRKDCYRWPYYFSRSTKRKKAAENLSKIFAAEADRLIEKHEKAVALICMESIDETFAKQTFKKIKNKKSAGIFSSKKYNASQMTLILQNLNYLISMRYHACVLAMASGIPMIGIAHDFRIPDLYQDIGLMSLCFNYKEVSASLLNENLDQLIINNENYQRLILNSYNQHLTRAKRNKELLASYLKNSQISDKIWPIQT